MLERTHRRIKSALHAQLAGLNWPLHRPGCCPAASEYALRGQRHLFRWTGLWSAGDTARRAPGYAKADQQEPGAVIAAAAASASKALVIRAETARSFPQQLLEASLAYVRRGAVFLL